MQRIGPFWIAGWVCQSVWQILFCANSPLGFIVSAVVLLGATRAFHGALDATHIAMRRSAGLFSVRLDALLSAASAVNAAWVATATAINVCIAVTTNTKLRVLPWAALLAASVALNGVRVTRVKKNLSYVVTLLWAFAGVYAAQAGEFALMKGTLTLAIASMVACGGFILATGGKRVQNSSGSSMPQAA